MIKKQTGEVRLEENCWTKGLDVFELYKNDIEAGYYLSFEGHHVYTYIITSSHMDGDTLKVTAKDQYATEEESEESLFSMYESQNNVWYIQEGSKSSYTLIRTEDKDKFTYIPCEEESSEPDIPVISGEAARLTIIDILFSINKKEEWDNISGLIPSEGILLKSTGDGLEPVTDTLHDVKDLFNTGLFTSEKYYGFMDYISDEEMQAEFVRITENAPDPCDLEHYDVLFIYLTYTEDRTGVKKADATLAFESIYGRQPYRCFTMTFEYDTEGKPMITCIDMQDCVE